MRTTLLKTARLARAGFTLIGLLAVILIIGILMTFLLPRIPEAIDQTRVTACKKNMQEIYGAMTLYQTKFNRVPKESGARFLAVLISSGTLENTKGAVQKLTCPGVDIGALTIGDLEPDQWFSDLELVDGSYTAYAGRDTEEYPLRKWPAAGTEVLVADDNDPEMNHRTATVVLYGDGSVDTYELSDLRDKGVLSPDEDLLIVGPESPVEALRKLSLD
jgi:type II secretory pathway pseudopilin PulG